MKKLFVWICMLLSYSGFAQFQILPGSPSSTTAGVIQQNESDARIKYGDGSTTLFLDGTPYNPYTYYFPLAAVNFQPVDIANNSLFSNELSVLDFYGGNFTVIAPVRQKNGAILERFIASVSDNSAFNNCIIELINYSGNLTTAHVIATIQSSGSSGWQNLNTYTFSPIEPNSAMAVRIRPSGTWDNQINITNVIIGFTK